MAVTHLYDDADGTLVNNTNGDLTYDTMVQVTPTANHRYLMLHRSNLGLGSSNSDLLAIPHDDGGTAIFEMGYDRCEPRTRNANTTQDHLAILVPYTAPASPAGDFTWKWGHQGSPSGGSWSSWPTLLGIDLTDIGVAGTDYYESLALENQAKSLSSTPDTTVLTTLSGTDLGTDEWLIFAGVRIDCGNTDARAGMTLWGADDASTATKLAESARLHTSGSDEAGFSCVVRHKASSGTPDVTLYADGTSDSASSWWLIAIPTSHFDTYSHSFTAASQALTGNHVLETISSVSPGDYIVVGSVTADSVTDKNYMYVAEDGTEAPSGVGTDWQYNNSSSTGGMDGEQGFYLRKRTLASATDITLVASGDSAEYRWLHAIGVDVTLDTTPPVITLVGANPQELEVDTSYVELGATATDDVDGDITGDIVIDATDVDMGTIGSYSVTYDVDDSSGNSATQVVRTVNVVAGGITSTLSAQGTAQLMSGTTLDFVGCLNSLAGTTGLGAVGALQALGATSGEIIGGINELASTTGLELDAAMQAWADSGNY